MTYVNWKIKGPKAGVCSCDYGCPCEFNGKPSLGNLCEGMDTMLIEEGWFGEGSDQVRLDGLIIAARYRWPGAVHDGGGVAQGLIDKRANDAQIEALFKILGGEEQEPTTVFNIYGSTIETEQDPVFADCEFSCDIKARRAHYKCGDVAEFTIEPIKNPVTGLDHFAQIVLPNGFEFRTAEMGSGTFTSSGDELAMDRKNVYAALWYAAYGPYGIVEDETADGMARALAA